VKADLAQLQMVLSAILSNASEAIEGEGRIKISAKNQEIDEPYANSYPGLKPGSYVSLTVEDDGTGMDEETKSRIFKPFFTTKFQGRGLGMAAVFGIIKNHGGWISVDSELGKGTTVRIFLPATEAKLKKLKKPKIEPTKGKGTILVIEDEEMVLDVCRELLKRLGYQVLGAKTGNEAINIAQTFDSDIDLAMLDIVLPDMGGEAVYPRIMKARPNLKVIVFSGYSIDGPAQEILNKGAQDYIQKPFTIAEISKKLKTVLGR
jgi:CheY-like chemotaxis protein